MKHKVNIKGAIISNDDKWIYDWFEMDSTCPKDVAKEIVNANGADIEVSINSGGGSVYDASEIYTELKNYSGYVEVQIVGLAASAASVIAMAGDVTKIAPTGELMIHNCSIVAKGDYHTMDKASEMLQNTNKSIANAYRLKSGKSEEELLAMMDEEVWLTPQKALEYGFVDEIMFENTTVKLSANTATETIPQNVIDRLRSNGMPNKQNIVTADLLKNTLADFKQDLLKELQPNNNNQQKEPEQDPPKANLSRLFL